MQKTVKRRSLLKVLVTLPAAATLTHNAFSMEEDTASSSLVVLDARLPPSPPLMDQVNVCYVEGDVTRPWFEDIKPHILHTGTPIRGQTLGDALFCLRELSQSLGWRVTVWSDANSKSTVDKIDLRKPYFWACRKRTDMKRIARSI